MPEGLVTLAGVAVGAIGAPALLGLGLVRCLGLHPAHGWRVAWALAYLVGHYVQAHVTMLWLVLGQPVPGLVLPIAAAVAGTWLTVRARRGRGGAFGRPPSPPSAWLPFVGLALLLLHDCAVANVDPIRLSDEAQIWASKAKVLYSAPIVDVKQGMAAIVLHADYPLFNPLVQVLSFASAGRTLQFENRWPIQCFGVALLALLSAAMTRRSHPLMAALVLMAFGGTLFWSSCLPVYADVMLAFAMLAVVECLLRWRETGERVWWRLGCLAAAAMLSTKNEGAMLALAVALPCLLGRFLGRSAASPGRLPRRELPWLLAPAAAIALHQAWNRWFGLTNDLLDPAVGGGRGLIDRILHSGPERAPQVAGFYGRMLVDPGAHRLLPLLFLLAAAVALSAHGRRWLRLPEATLLATVVCGVLGYMLVFVGTSADLQWHLSTAAARTMQQVVPVAALGLCLTVWPRGRS